MTSHTPIAPHAPRRLARRASSALLLVAGALALVGCSSTPPPVSVIDQGDGTREAGIEIDLEGPVDVAFRKVIIQPGEGTGPHCHDGNLIAVVTQGTLTHYAPIYASGVHEYGVGDAILEGAGYVHEGKNEGTEPVILEVTYLIEDGSPLAETDLSKCDPEA
ncbi:MAG: cupin domain-containing protein [Demequinaceae bacterium]|nr:cupin domain-containing protein [Demequinaceae bacterium]